MLDPLSHPAVVLPIYYGSWSVVTPLLLFLHTFLTLVLIDDLYITH